MRWSNKRFKSNKKTFDDRLAVKGFLFAIPDKVCIIKRKLLAFERMKDYVCG